MITKEQRAWCAGQVAEVLRTFAAAPEQGAQGGASPRARSLCLSSVCFHSALNYLLPCLSPR